MFYKNYEFYFAIIIIVYQMVNNFLYNPNLSDANFSMLITYFFKYSLHTLISNERKIRNISKIWK
jgi:hypothetical protein